ncbi:unnamed protein product [Rhizoctonia solani]|uniref:Protein kinase domain-containing protein n=1 Tax=Rhizoctonia solani TaxID=456999 RepID=A0A8H3AC29_9AGAM|nr:unnamed protein product [Rhizoctonia solani]
MFGGLSKDIRELGDAWSFKISEQRWYRFPSMDSAPSARWGHILATAQTCVFLVGGVDSDRGNRAKVHKLDINLIDHPAQGEEIIVRTMPHIKQPGPSLLIDASEEGCRIEEGLSRSFGGAAQRIGSESEAVRAASTQPETNAGHRELDAAIDNQRTDKPGAPSEGHPRTETGTALPSTQDTITGAMSATEILRYLVLHGCRDISNVLDISHVTEFPVSSGGFGDVYCATLSNGDRVGFKCMRMLVGSTEEGRKFLKHAAHELYVWSKCRHPSILELSGVTIFRDQIAMVSPWVEHGHLRWFLSQHPQANRCALCIGIADGVDYMHKKGVIHGDMKPENILVSKDHTPKLTDFRNAVISKYTLQFLRSNTTPSMSMRWTAPEILSEETKTTQAGDVYALGMIVFEVMTGILPYDGVREPSIMRRILAGQVPSRPEAHIPAGVDQADRLWSLITSCWAFDPKERPGAWKVKDMATGWNNA